MSTKHALVICTSLSVILLFPACASYPDFSVSGIALVEEKNVFSYQGSEIEAIGFVKATINTDIDLVKQAAKTNLNLWYEVSGCTTGNELDKWPYLYPIESSESKFSYQVIFNYRSVRDSNSQYNLAETREDLCFVLGMGDVGLLSGKPSRYKVRLEEEFFLALERYDEKNGLVNLTLSESCRERICIPSYAK